MKKLLSLVLLMSVSGFCASVNLKDSKLKWTGSKLMSKHWGEVSFKTAEVSVTENKLVSGKFVVDMNTITVTDITDKGTAAKFLGHVKTGDFFEVNKYPTSILKVTKVTPQKMMGDLTIKGKTLPIAFPYKKNGNLYEGTMSFDRTKYGITYNSSNFFKKIGDKAIKDTVDLDFKIAIQ